MKKIGILFILTGIMFIFLINLIFAQEYIDVSNITIGSFGGIIESDNINEIYVSSIIYYDIILFNNNSQTLENLAFGVIIKNPFGYIIENKTFNSNINNYSNFTISSKINNNERELIYVSTEGVYQLILTISPINIQLYDDGTYLKNTRFQRLNDTMYLQFLEYGGAYRHDSSLPFFFEVKSLQEKRINYANEGLIERNEKIAERNEDINRNLFRLTFLMLIVSVINLILIWKNK